jgi:phage baseplate assembly protein W
MSANIPIPIGEIEQERELPSRTYKLDFDRKRISGKIDGLEAVNQFIRKTLVTPRFKCLIYDNQYGSEIKQTIIADDATTEYIKSEIPRLVRDALSADKRILDVYNFDFSFDTENVYLSFSVNTVFGTSVIQEVI